MKQSPTVVLACIFVAVGGAVAMARQKPLEMVLQWRVSVQHSVALPAVDLTGGLRTLKVEPVVDTRDMKTRENVIERQIGDNTEKQLAVPTQDTDEYM